MRTEETAVVARADHCGMRRRCARQSSCSGGQVMHELHGSTSVDNDVADPDDQPALVTNSITYIINSIHTCASSARLVTCTQQMGLSLGGTVSTSGMSGLKRSTALTMSSVSDEMCRRGSYGMG